MSRIVTILPIPTFSVEISSSSRIIACARSLLDLCDTGLDKTLLVLCLIVLTVLGKVAEGTCQLYLLGNFGADYGFEIFKLCLELLNA